MKKYQKLNLNSYIYKQAKSKSPFTSRNGEDQSENQSAKKLYQNVCCPNCRYLFKVIKEQYIPKTPIIKSAIEKVVKTRTSTTQTDDFDLKIKTSPKRQSVQVGGRDRTPIQSIYEQSSSRMRNSVLDRYLDERGLSRTPKKDNRIELKSAVQMDKNRSIEQLSFPSKSRYTEQKTESRPKIISTVSRLKNQKQDEEMDVKMKELIDRIYLSEQIKQILQYNMEQSPQVSIPSYCKMLLYDFSERGQKNSHVDKP